MGHTGESEEFHQESVQPMKTASHARGARTCTGMNARSCAHIHTRGEWSTQAALGPRTQHHKVERAKQRSGSKLLLACTRARTHVHKHALGTHECKVIDTWRNPYLYIIQCAGDPSVSAASERLLAALLYAIKSLCAAFSSPNNSSLDWLCHRRIAAPGGGAPKPKLQWIDFFFPFFCFAHLFSILFYFFASERKFTWCRRLRFDLWSKTDN